MKNPKLLVVLFLAIGLVNCKSGKPEDFDYGEVVDNTYSNAYFGMTMDIPEDYYVQSQAELEDMAKQGGKLLGDDIITKAKLKAVEINSANLLSVFKADPKTNVASFNSNLVMVAENTASAIGISSGKDYLEASKKVLEQTQLDYTFDDDATGTENFGGQEFDYMDAVLSYSGVKIKQRYYSTIINGFSLNFITSNEEGNQDQKLNEILESINFD